MALLSFLLPVLALASSQDDPYTSPRSFCSPSFSCWPTESELSTFSASLSHPLITSLLPSGWYCHEPHYDASLCSTARAGYLDGDWRRTQPGYGETPTWEGIDCGIRVDQLNGTGPVKGHCKDGSFQASWAVNATSANDVVKAVEFANKHDLRVVVKATGHDFLGRSTAPDALLIWTHYMLGTSYDPSFRLDKCSYKGNDTEGPALTVNAGTLWRDAYEAAESANRTIVGGVCQGGTISAGGGWVLGAGHAGIAPSSGLGVDNVLQFTVVTASGELVNASRCENEDLFWAMRGGGGGTWGVTTKVVYRTHDHDEILYWFFELNATAAGGGDEAVLERYEKGIAELFRSWHEFADEDWGGYFYPTGYALGIPSDRYAMVFLLSPPVTSPADATRYNASAIALLDKLNATMDGVAQAQYSVLDAWIDFVEGSFNASLPSHPDGGSWDGRPIIMGGRLLPVELWKDRPEAMAKLTVDLVNVLGADVTFGMVTGGYVNRVDPDAMGLNPAWRDAAAGLMLQTVFEDDAPLEVRKAAVDRVKNATALVDAVNPGGGCYLNEANLAEDNWQHVFFGDHYDKLLEIKKKWDPTKRFVVAKGVGWVEGDYSGLDALLGME